METLAGRIAQIDGINAEREQADKESSHAAETFARFVFQVIIELDEVPDAVNAERDDAEDDDEGDVALCVQKTLFHNKLL